MEFKREYLQKYIGDAAIDQIADEYANKGYKVSKHEQIEKAYADLVARKDNETIFIEVKSGAITQQKKDAIDEISKLVKNASNYKFLVVLAPSPKEKKLEFSNIDDLLESYLRDNIPDELDLLSKNTRINEVSDVNIDEIAIQPDGLVLVNGTGLVNVNIQIGSDADTEGDQGGISNENFSFEFEVVIKQDENKKFKISDVTKLDVDTKGF